MSSRAKKNLVNTIIYYKFYFNTLVYLILVFQQLEQKKL